MGRVEFLIAVIVLIEFLFFITSGYRIGHYDESAVKHKLYSVHYRVEMQSTYFSAPCIHGSLASW